MLLHKVHTVSRGEWLLVHAAAGGLGQLVTRWAKRMGANVIGTVGSAAKIPQAIAAGADEVLLHGDEQWPKRAMQIADGKGSTSPSMALVVTCSCERWVLSAPSASSPALANQQVQFHL